VHVTFGEFTGNDSISPFVAGVKAACIASMRSTHSRVVGRLISSILFGWGHDGRITDLSTTDTSLPEDRSLPTGNYRLAMTADANSEVFTSFAPSIWRAKS